MNNPELLALFQADRADHSQGLMAGTADYRAMRERDLARREDVSRLLESLTEPTPDDLYHAAWIFNHGDSPDEAKRAYDLAVRARDGGCGPGRWLSAAAFDRWCMYCGLPQRYGTQIVPDGVGYRLWDVEPGVTDDERAEQGVPPLAEQQRLAEESACSMPQPPMDQAPAWLRSALERWRAIGG